METSFLFPTETEKEDRQMILASISWGIFVSLLLCICFLWVISKRSAANCVYRDTKHDWHYTKAHTEKGSTNRSEKQTLRTFSMLLASLILAQIPYFDMGEHLSFFICHSSFPCLFPCFTATFPLLLQLKNYSRADPRSQRTRGTCWRGTRCRHKAAAGARAGADPGAVLRVLWQGKTAAVGGLI